MGKKWHKKYCHILKLKFAKLKTSNHSSLKKVLGVFFISAPLPVIVKNDDEDYVKIEQEPDWVFIEKP